MKAEQSHGLIKGALLLTLAGFIGKVLSAGYRIPLQNLIGDAGFYIYQQVYPILGVAIMLGLYGFPAAVSKLTVEQSEEGRMPSWRSFYGPVSLILVIINGLFFLTLYAGADQLAQFAGDPALASGYRLTAYIFLFIPVTSLLRGVMQGRGDMQATAYSQVAEQFVRAIIIIMGAYVISRTGSDIYAIGKIGAVASMTGAFAAILVLGPFVKKDKSRSIVSHQHPVQWRRVLKVIGGFGLIAALNHMVLIIVQAVDMVSLVPQLQAYGLTKEAAIKAKGIFDRGQPLIQLGTVLGSSFALALIPTITKKTLERDPASVKQSVGRTLAFSFYLAGGATIGLIMIFPETNTLLFQNDDGTFALRVLALALLLSSVAITAISILQGAGFMMMTACLIVGAGIVKWIGNAVFVPIWGITGSAVATVVALGLLTLVVLVLLSKKLAQFAYKGFVSWSVFLLGGLSMSAFLAVIKWLVPMSMVPSRGVLFFYVIGLVLSGALIYITILIRFGALKDDDIAMLPFASKLMKLRKGRI
ncbi:putative polysaccharide biosynthesis protein [Lentibacillus saliphilus]|uniref:putative polysaccharide biosynthesis protein n=1 Tax=Lentibacillus saliphilus TaxID=2737028 RepID=UPI001C3013CA|nr:oligosaccharide flippase family protein [Lentibacillus saliphilus]